jgi:hypothetical protein
VSVVDASENLIRFYFKDGSIYNISYGPVKDKGSLDILDGYNLDKVIYFDGMKATNASADLPPAEEIIKAIRRIDKQVQVD